MSLVNIDDKLVAVQRNEPVEAIVAEKVTELPQEVAESPVQDTDDEAPAEKLSYLEQFRKDKEESLARKSEDSTEKPQSQDLDSQKAESKSQDSQETDDYGNVVPKAKTYTEEEVQAMIRKRLKLHHEERQQPAQPQYQPQQPTQQLPNGEFQHDATSEVPWEVQLEQHIEQTVQKIESKKQQAQWQQEQQRAQAEFEAKFTNGMSKYDDFVEVVSTKPITNGILMAARSMADPAAFIYAAAKQQPKELERIAQIQDPYVLAAEVGRLEERMRKARTVSRAPKPATKTKGDMADKGHVKARIDDLIRFDAKRKLGRR